MCDGKFRSSCCLRCPTRRTQTVSSSSTTDRSKRQKGTDTLASGKTDGARETAKYSRTTARHPAGQPGRHADKQDRDRDRDRARRTQREGERERAQRRRRTARDRARGHPTGRHAEAHRYSWSERARARGGLRSRDHRQFEHPSQNLWEKKEKHGSRCTGHAWAKGCTCVRPGWPL